MAISKADKTLIEKLTGKKYNEWQEAICSQEGQELIRGKGELRDVLIDRHLTTVVKDYILKNDSLNKSKEVSHATAKPVDIFDSKK